MGNRVANSYNTTVKVGVIQTKVDRRVAWRSLGPTNVQMDRHVQHVVWDEIRLSLNAFRDHDEKVDIVLIPELSVPQGRRRTLETLSQKLHSIIIAGMDYQLDVVTGNVVNEAVAFIPRYWGSSRYAKSCETIAIGKTYPAPVEKREFDKHGLRLKSEPHFWVFQSKSIGNFGVCICYDLMDLERATLLRKRIHHLFVLAYNQDIESFYHLAESLSRTLFCNVVVCNTGYYGGTVAISPKYAPWERTVYRHEGSRLVTAQAIQLPVASLAAAWKGLDRSGPSSKRQYKAAPPGFSDVHDLVGAKKNLS